MAGKKDVHFKANDKVAAKAETLNCPNKTGQLMTRSGLTAEELQQKMEVADVSGDQLHLRHGRLSKPFVVHKKFFEHATA